MARPCHSVLGLHCGANLNMPDRQGVVTGYRMADYSEVSRLPVKTRLSCIRCSTQKTISRCWELSAWNASSLPPSAPAMPPPWQKRPDSAALWSVAMNGSESVLQVPAASAGCAVKLTSVGGRTTSGIAICQFPELADFRFRQVPLTHQSRRWF